MIIYLFNVVIFRVATVRGEKRVTDPSLTGTSNLFDMAFSAGPARHRCQQWGSNGSNARHVCLHLCLHNYVLLYYETELNIKCICIVCTYLWHVGGAMQIALPVSASPLCWTRHSRHLWHRGRRGRGRRGRRSKTGQGLGNTMGSDGCNVSNS